MDQSANCIKETSSSGFYPEEPPGFVFFFLQEAGSPSLSQWSSWLHLSWAQTGAIHHEGFGMLFVLEQAQPLLQTISPFPIPTPLSQGPCSSYSEF